MNRKKAQQFESLVHNKQTCVTSSKGAWYQLVTIKRATG